MAQKYGTEVQPEEALVEV